jgi:hypothetical protein
MKTATSPEQAPKRTRTRKAAAGTKRKRGTGVVRTLDDEQDFTPERLEDSLEGELAPPTAGMHGEDLDDTGLDPDALEEVAGLEAAVAGDPPVGEIDDAITDGGAGDEVASVDGEPDEDQEEAEPDLGALLTGMLVPEPDPGVDDDDRDVSGLEIEYVPTARGNEFVCSACFLIWNRRHLADAERRVCRDCIDDVAPAPRREAAA